MTTRLYLDIHILQTLPPSNVNRDDSGSPKHAVYGGVRRARVSSQAWKRASRVAFAQRVPRPDLATRTTKITTLLAALMNERCGIGYDQAQRVSSALVTSLGIKLAVKRGEDTSDTPYLLFFGRAQLDGIIDLVADRVGELAAMPDDELAAAAKELPIAEQLGSGHPVDVALFGRMVADRADLNVDGACQVAHALSTHAVDTEFDYYTVIDDAVDTKLANAAMIGTVEFNSATLYRYATVALHVLERNLGDPDATADAAELFLDSFTRSMPTGHRNSFAHRTLPHLVAVTLNASQPVNLVSAFEDPVQPQHGIATTSAQRLARDLAAVESVWGIEMGFSAASYSLAESDGLSEVFGEPVPFPALLHAVRDEVVKWSKGDTSDPARPESPIGHG